MKRARCDVAAGSNFAVARAVDAAIEPADRPDFRGVVRSVVRGVLRKIKFIWARLDAPRDCIGHELIDELVQAGLTAQVLGAGTQPVARTPTGNPQLAPLVVRYEPMIRLSLFTSANVARYCLPDHQFPPVRTVVPAV